MNPGSKCKARELNRNRWRIRRHTLVALLSALTCAAIYVSLPFDIFPDRESYLAYAGERSRVLVDFYSESGLLMLILNEPIWLYLNIAFGKLFDPQTTVKIFIFFGAFVVYFYGISKVGPWFLLFVLFSIHPIFSTNHLHHIRFALALAIFVIGFYSKRNDARILCVASAGMIHIAFLVIAIIYLISKAPHYFKQRRIVSGAVLFGFGFIFLFGLPVFDGTARQVQRYVESDIAVGGGLFLIALSIFVIFLMQQREFILEHSFAIMALGFYIALYWVFPYSRRFLDAAMLFVLIAGFNLPGKYRLAFIAIMGFLLVTFLYGRWGVPYLGLARHV